MTSIEESTFENKKYPTHSSSEFKTPIAIILFNRPNHTERLIHRLKEIRPSKIYAIIDGPRRGKPNDVDAVNAVMGKLKLIDWKCELKINQSKTNLGCRIRPVSGLDWVFSQEEEAIILEDDCIPNLSFFQFCQENLDKYRDISDVGLISGTNPCENLTCDTEYSYVFSTYPQIWGWATWKNRWQNYDHTITGWNARNTALLLKSKGFSKKGIRHWNSNFKKVHDTNFDAWDYQLAFQLFNSNALAIIPKYNLITNTGFGVDATHTVLHSPFSGLQTKALKFPLIHPTVIKQDFRLDQALEMQQFSMSKLKQLTLGLIDLFQLEAIVKVFIKEFSEITSIFVKKSQRSESVEKN